MNDVTQDLDSLHRKTCGEVFLEQMKKVVLWQALGSLIHPYARSAHQALGGCSPFAVEIMLRIRCRQSWWNLGDPAMEEKLYERPPYWCFSRGLDGSTHLPDEGTILRFRRFLVTRKLAPQAQATINAWQTQQGILLETIGVLQATIIAVPSTTKNSIGDRDPEMHQTKKGYRDFGMKTHIGLDVDWGLVHTAIGTAANVYDVTQASALVYGEVSDVFVDAGYHGVSRREESQDIDANWHLAMRTGKREAPGQEHADGRGHGQARTYEGQHPGQGGVPIPCHQAPVQACEGALPRLGQEHGAVVYAVCAFQSVDGAPNAFERDPGMSAPAVAQWAANGRKWPLE